jgi:hypothetical protein
MRVTRHATPSVTCLDFSLYLDGPLNTQGTYKIHDWTTFARVMKNVCCIPSTGNTTANSQLSKRAVAVYLNVMPSSRGIVNIA